jgi:predicted 3-demethylubiquinone-9 3-methyltransferase (glyoxalase superfamily)
MNYYCSVFPDSRPGDVVRYGDAMPELSGKVMSVNFELMGQRIMGLNGGPQFKFTEAVSFFVECQDQEEVDKYWYQLRSDGGQEGQCGWLKDKYGLSWQIIPKQLGEMMADPDPEKSKRVVQAMLQMKKIDVAELEQARDGQQAS